MNIEDYILEGLRQLNNTKTIEDWDWIWQKNSMNKFKNTIENGYRTNIITLDKAEILHSKSHRISNFYMLPKIH